MLIDPKSVIFDFDFTLADSSRGVCECVDFALSQMNLDSVPRAKVSKTIGLSLARTFEKLAPESEWHRVDEFSTLFGERADEVMVDMTRIFPSVPAVLEELVRRGLVLGIVSTKFRYRIQEILQREGLSGFWRVIIGGEDVSAHKPDPGGLLVALGSLGHSCRDSLYVGDHSIDAETARSANVPFIAVLSGTTPREQFELCEVLCILEDLGELPKVLVPGEGRQRM